MVVLAIDDQHADRCRLSGDYALQQEPCGVGKSGHKGCMAGGAKCLTHDLWEEMGRQIHSYLASVTVADVLEGRLRPEAKVAA